MDAIWRSRFTHRNRYRGPITDAVVDYAGKTGKGSLSILDVGCSTGVAIRSMAGVLGGSGIAARTTGVEVSPKAWKEAEGNLDILIRGDIREIEPRPDFDVVLCFKMILFQTPEVRREVLSACAAWLKRDGLLATDAHERYKTPWRREVLRTVLGRDEALKYPDAVLDGWNALGPYCRLGFWLSSYIMRAFAFLFRF